MSWTKLDALTWSNRDPVRFFDSVVKSNDILSRFTLYDGIKSKKEIPIFEATLVYDDSVCTYAPASTADVSEKEFTTHFKRWGFKNCKDQLENTYRSAMLTKGQLNAETLDDQFREWVYDWFVKKNGENILLWSWSGDAVAVPGVGESAGGDIDGIKAELVLDSAVINVDGSSVGATLTDETKILDHLRLAYKNLGSDNLNALFGDADREFKPVFALSTAAYQAYQLDVADAETTTYEGIEKGLLKTFLGMEVVHYSPLSDTEMLVTPLSNLVLATDEYSDATAIQAEYDNKTNSDQIWGQFKIGFSYKKGEDIVYYTTA